MDGSGTVATAPFAFGLQHRLCHFLDEQRNAITTLNYVLPNALRQCPTSGNLPNQGGDFAFTETIEVERCDVERPHPRGLELGSVRNNQQHGQFF